MSFPVDIYKWGLTEKNQLFSTNSKLNIRTSRVVAPNRQNVVSVMGSPPAWTFTTANPITSPMSYLAIQTTNSGAVSKLDGSWCSYFGAAGPVRLGSSSPSYNAIGFSSVQKLGVASWTSAVSSFMTSASAIAIAVVNPSGGLGGTGAITVKVDDQYIMMPEQVVPGDGNTYYLYVPLSTLQVASKVRRIDVQFAMCGFIGVYVPNGAWCAPAPQRGPTTVVMGDSYTYGQGAITPLGSWARRLADTLGWDNVHQSGVSGTSYAHANGASVAYTARLATDVYAISPEVVVWTGGINDWQLGGPTSLATFQAAALTCAQGVQQNVQNALQIFVAPFYPGGASALPSGFIAYRDALKTVAAQVGGLFVDHLEPALPTGVTPLATTATVTSGSATITMQDQPVQRATYKWMNGERFQCRSFTGTGPYTVTADAGQLNTHTGESVVQCGSPLIVGTGHAATVQSTARVGGSGGTDGTYPMIITSAASPSNIIRQPAGTFTVAGGAVVSQAYSDPGQFSSTTAPAISLANCPGLTGASLTPTLSSGPQAYGNADIEVGADALHPLQPGHDNYGNNVGYLMMQALGPN